MLFTADRRPAFLASVTNPAEARLVVACGADIIDAKDPASGALGALPIATVRTIRAAVPSHIPVSATIGDLVGPSATIAEAAAAMAATGVDYLKLGLFSGIDIDATLPAVRAACPGVGLVAVLLADAAPDFSLVPRVAAAGFAAVMLDTAGKHGSTLLDHQPLPRLADFVALAREHGLAAGLAGSLRATDIASLTQLTPDILGFRGALCAGRDRRASLDAAAIAAVRRALPIPAKLGRAS